MNARRTTWLAWSLGLLCTALAAGSLLFGALNGITPYAMLTKDQGLFTVATLVVAFALVGAPIAAHRPSNPIGWICCGAALFQGLNIFGEGYSRYALLTAPGALPGGALVAWLAQWIWAPGLVLFLIFLPLLFPTGRPPSRRWRWVAWLAGAALALQVVPMAILLWPLRGPALVDFNGPPPGPPWLIGLVNAGFPLLLLAGLAAVVSLLVRFRRAMGDERQQLKWFAFAAALTFATVVGTQLLAQSGIHGPLLDVPVAVLGLLIIPSLPVAVGIAILRYRLYDIDVLINRTLVYGTLTVALALVYLGDVALFQGFLRGLTGQRSDLAVVAATLLVAVLFHPLRQRLQASIDRRFYRRKYDAARTLAAFGATVRDEVDLDTLTAQVVAVVEQTLHPAHVSLWLAPGAGDGPAPGASPAFEIAPDDPLLAHVQSASGPVDLATVHLSSPALQGLHAAGVTLVVPLVSRGALLGLLSLGPRRSGQGYSTEDRALLADLATQATPAVRVAQLVRQQHAEIQARERVEQELRVARLIQHTLLPKERPALPGWHVAAHYQPAWEVGGDFYDFLALPEGRLGLIIGDVSDKGVPAALVMATTRSVLRGAAQQAVSPGQVLERANELLYPDIPPAMFVTCFYAVLDPASGQLRYANAGHDLPYLRHVEGVSELRARGMPLGLMPGMRYEEQTASIAPAELVLLYSDGLVEAHNGQREMFGFPRLRDLMAAQLAGDGPALIALLLADLRQFTGAAWEQEDDITLVALHYLSSH